MALEAFRRPVERVAMLFGLFPVRPLWKLTSDVLGGRPARAAYV